jgi:sugar phosphate isomerase/epimerase
MKSTNTDAVAGPEPFEQAVSFSKNHGMSFDVGDATAGGYDALKFVEDHHDKIVLLYLKDRRKTGEKVPFGEGDAPIRQVLRLVRDRKYRIPFYLDCDYSTSSRPTDVKRSFAYAKAALE